MSSVDAPGFWAWHKDSCLEASPLGYELDPATSLADSETDCYTINLTARSVASHRPCRPDRRQEAVFFCTSTHLAMAIAHFR